MSHLMREPTTKDIAEYFRLALEAGLCHENEVESWADTMIAETSSPIPDWLLKLSVEKETSKNALLQAVPGVANELTLWSLLLARISIANRVKQISREQILSVLNDWSLTRNREIPKPICGDFYGLFQSFDGVEEGWHPEEKFIKDVEDFFVQFRSFEPFVPQSTFQVLR